MSDTSILTQAILLSEIKTEILAISSTVLQADYLPDLIEELQALENQSPEEKELLYLALFMQRYQYRIAALLVNMENEKASKATQKEPTN